MGVHMYALNLVCTRLHNKIISLQLTETPTSTKKHSSMTYVPAQQRCIHPHAHANLDCGLAKLPDTPSDTTYILSGKPPP
jgi:hypothetical protein